MSEDYRSMWKDLGLNLEAHDALLNVLGQAYKDIYLSQEDRPDEMKYFDFVISNVHSLRITIRLVFIVLDNWLSWSHRDRSTDSMCWPRSVSYATWNVGSVAKYRNTLKRRRICISPIVRFRN